MKTPPNPDQKPLSTTDDADAAVTMHAEAAHHHLHKAHALSGHLQAKHHINQAATHVNALKGLAAARAKKKANQDSDYDANAEPDQDTDDQGY